MLAGSVPTLSIVPDPLTNYYGSVDANGNALYSPSGTYLIYDAENRLTNAGTAQYAYDGRNKRIWAVNWDSTYSFYTSETYSFYSPQGKLMARVHADIPAADRNTRFPDRHAACLLRPAPRGAGGPPRLAWQVLPVWGG